MRNGARFVNLTIGPGNQSFQVEPRFRLGRERRHLAQIARHPFVEVVKPTQFIQRQPLERVAFQVIKHALKLTPVKRFRFDKSLEVNDHGRLTTSASP